jgi:hypothetical protein
MKANRIDPDVAIFAKRGFKALDLLISDEQVLKQAQDPELLRLLNDEWQRQRCVEESAGDKQHERHEHGAIAWNDVEAPPNPLHELPEITLVTCLLGLDWKHFLVPLEQYLQALEHAVPESKRRSLAKHLLNGSRQFLHTYSELGLASQFHEHGFSVNLFQVFFGRKDVDFAAERGTDVRFVEVINLQAEPLTTQGWAERPGIDQRIVGRVVSKCRKKFGEAFASGWDGPAWIAMDYGKRHECYIAGVFMESLGDDWKRASALRVFESCPQLRGVIYYTFSIDSGLGGSIRCFGNPKFAD